MPLTTSHTSLDRSSSPTRTRRPERVRPTRCLGVALLTALTATAALGAPGVAADPTRTPASVVSADGRSATDGVRTLTVSQSQGLSAGGQQIRVTGSGYDMNKGIYVALCVIPPPNVLPTPCGGGVDIEGQAGASQWISSNPPSYGVGLARPYGPGGAFDTTFSVSPIINPTVDCRFVRCGVLTRNDHMRTADRSQDIIIPVTFVQPAAPGTPAPPPPPGSVPGPGPGGVAPSSPGADPAAPSLPAPTAPPVTPAPTITTTTTTPPAPDATVNDDGTEVSDGVRTLRVERAGEIDRDGDTVTVEGAGFDTGRGVYVALCRVASGSDAAPGPCATGEERSVWLSNDPPEWGAELARSFDDDGSFRIELAVDPVIDGDTDCTETDCAIAVRADDTAATDRSLDLALPVSFVEVETDAGTDAQVDVAGVTATAEDDAASDEATSSVITDDSSGSALPLLMTGVLAAALLATGTGLWLRRRGSPGVASAADPGDSEPTVGLT